jgi:phospholipase/carboxylesterase
VRNSHATWERGGLHTLLLTVKSQQLTVRVIGLASANFESNIAPNKYLGFYSPRHFIIVAMPDYQLLITMSLQFISIPPTTDRKPVALMVALHGWGANARDLTSLAPAFNLPDYQFVFPDAPFPHPQVMGGKAWYDLQSKDPQGLVKSRQLLREFLLSLESSTGVPLSRTILGGFSQGGAMTLDVGLTLPVAGLICLSGYLHPISPVAGSALPPVLIVHGTQDTIVPVTAAVRSRDSLTAWGAAVQYREFIMGHEIRPEVIDVMRSFVVETVSKSD